MKRSKKVSNNSQSSCMLNEQTVSRQIMLKMKHKYNKGRVDTFEKGIPVVSVHARTSKQSTTSGAVAVASQPQAPSASAQGQRIGAALIHHQKPNAAAMVGEKGQLLHAKTQSAYGKVGNKAQQPLNLISVSREGTAELRGGAAMAGLGTARARDGGGSKESTMKQNQLMKQQKLFMQYKVNNQGSKEPVPKVPDQSAVAQQEAYHSTPAAEQQHRIYMKKRMARRSRNAAARKSLSQNTADFGHKSRQVVAADGQPGLSKVADRSVAGQTEESGGGAGRGANCQRSPETDHLNRHMDNFSYKDAAPSQSSLAGNQGRAGAGVVMQYQNMLIGDQSAGHLTQITSSNYSKSYRRQTHQTAGKESQTGKSAITNPSGRENVVDTTQNDDPTSSYRQSCATALRNFSNADLSAKTMLRKGRGANSRKEANPRHCGDLQHLTVFNQRFPQMDARANQSQIQFRNLNQRLQNEGQNSYEDVRRTAGAEELLRQQLPSLQQMRGRNSGNRHFTQQQASQVPIRSVNIGLTENPSSSGGGPTNNIDRHSSSLLTIGLPSAGSHAGVPPVLHVKGSKEQPEALNTGLHLVAADAMRTDEEMAEQAELPADAIEIQIQRDTGVEAPGDQVATAEGEGMSMMEENRGVGGRAQSGGRVHFGRTHCGKSRSQAAQAVSGGGLTSVQSKFQKYQLMKDSVVQRQGSSKAGVSDSSGQVNQQTFLTLNSQSQGRSKTRFADAKGEGDGAAEARAGPAPDAQVRASEQRHQTWSTSKENFLLGGMGASEMGHSTQLSGFGLPGEAPQGATFRRVIPQKKKGPNGGSVVTASAGPGPNLLGQNAQTMPHDGRRKLHDMLRKKNYRIQREQSGSLKRRDDSIGSQEDEARAASGSLMHERVDSAADGIHDVVVRGQSRAEDEDEKQALNLEDVARVPVGGGGHQTRLRPEGARAEEQSSCYGDDEAAGNADVGSRRQISNMQTKQARSPKPRAANQLVSRSQSRNMAQTLLEANSAGAQGLRHQSQVAGRHGAGPQMAEGPTSQGHNTTHTVDLSRESKASMRSKVSQLSIKTNVSLKKRRRQIQQQFNLQRLNGQLQQESADSDGGQRSRNEEDSAQRRNDDEAQLPMMVIENQEGVHEQEEDPRVGDLAIQMTFNSRPADDMEEALAYGQEDRPPTVPDEGADPRRDSPPKYYPGTFNEKEHYKYIEGISNQIGGFNERPESVGSFRSSSQFSNNNTQNPNQDESLFEGLASSVVNKPQGPMSVGRDREPPVLSQPDQQRPGESSGRANDRIDDGGKINEVQSPYYNLPEHPGADSLARRAAYRLSDGAPSSDSIGMASPYHQYAQRMVSRAGNAEPSAFSSQRMTSAAVPSAAAVTRSAQEAKFASNSQHFFHEARGSRPIPKGYLGQSPRPNHLPGLGQPSSVQFAPDDVATLSVHPYGSATRQSQDSQQFHLGLDIVESQKPLCPGTISASMRQRANLNTSAQDQPVLDAAHARVRTSSNCMQKASDKTSVQQFTSIFNDIRMSSSKDSFRTSHVSDAEFKNTNTGNFNESNTLDSAENGPTANGRQASMVQQESRETLYHPSAQQQEEQMDKYIDLTLVDPQIPQHAVNPDQMINPEGHGTVDGRTGAQNQVDAPFQVQQVVQESNMRLDCMNTTEEEEDEDEDRQSLRTFRQQQAYEGQQVHFQQHEPSRYSSRHQAGSNRQSSSRKRGANQPFGNDRSASKFWAGQRGSEQEQEAAAYRQTTTEQSQIMFEQRELVNRELCREVQQQREREDPIQDDEHEEEGEDEIVSRRIDASPLESPHTATGLVYEKNSGGTMIKMQKPSESDPDYLRRIIASSSENCGGIHSKLESLSGITAIHKQHSRPDSLILLQQSQKIGVDSTTYNKQREAILNQRDNAARSKHFFSACDGHVGPDGQVFHIQSPQEHLPQGQHQRLTKQQQKSMNKNVKSMQIDNSIENQYYISSQSPGRGLNKKNVTLEESQQLHYYNRGTSNQPKVSGETPARTSNDRQRSNGSKIYVQSNLMSLLSGENNNQIESVNGGELQEAGESNQTPMNKDSEGFDKSNIESSNETSNNVSQNFLNQSSRLSGTRKSQGRCHGLQQKRTTSSKGQRGAADDTNSQALVSIDLGSQSPSRHMNQTAIKNRSLLERLRGENEEAVGLDGEEFLKVRVPVAVGDEGHARASSGFDEGCRSLIMTEYQNKRALGRFQDGGRAGSSTLTVQDHANAAAHQATIVSRYRVRQVPVSNTPKRLRNISSSQKKSPNGGGSSNSMRDASSIKISAMPNPLGSPPVYYDDEGPRAKYAAPVDSPGQHRNSMKNINFYKNSSGRMSQEQSLSPSALPTPQLSIQQDSQKRNVYHIFGKESEIDLKNQKHTGSSLSQKNNSVAARRQRGGKAALFESINNCDREVPGKLTLDGASTLNCARADRSVLELVRQGRSARAGLVGKYNSQVEGTEQQAAHHPRRKLLFSLGQQKMNQNLMQGAAIFNDANSMAPDINPQLLRRDQRVKKFKTKGDARQGPLEDEYVNTNGVVDHSVSQRLELLRSSTTVLEMSEINQGVQYDQRGRGIKSAQSGPSQHGGAGFHKTTVAQRTHDANGAYNERSSYFSAQNNTMNLAPSDIQYQLQSKEAEDGPLDGASRAFASEQRSVPGWGESSRLAGHSGQKRKPKRKAKPRNIYESQTGAGQFESRSAQGAPSSSVVMASSDYRVRKINGSRAALNLNRIITRGFQESSSLEPQGPRGPPGGQEATSSQKTHVVEPELATNSGNLLRQQHEVNLWQHEHQGGPEENRTRLLRGSWKGRPQENRGNGEMLCQDSISVGESPERHFQSRFQGAQVPVPEHSAYRDQARPQGVSKGQHREGIQRHHLLRRLNQSEGRQMLTNQGAGNADGVVTIGAGMSKAIEQTKLASQQRNRIITFRSTERYLKQNGGDSNESLGRANKRNGNTSQDETTSLAAWCCMNSKSRNNSQESLAANRSVGTAGAAPNSDSKSSVCSVF